MKLKKRSVKLFQFEVPSANSITHFQYKIPRELIAIDSILITCFVGRLAHIVIQLSGYLTLHINDKKINLFQRYSVFGMSDLFGRTGSDRKFLPVGIPIKVDEEVIAGSLINAIYQDTGLSNSYPYTVKVYIYGTIEKELINK